MESHVTAVGSYGYVEEGGNKVIKLKQKQSSVSTGVSLDDTTTSGPAPVFFEAAATLCCEF